VDGQKFDTQCPALKVGSVPNKDDFTDVAEFQERDGSGNLFFYGGAIRLVANGNASGDVEFNQAAGNGTTSAGCRTANDRLIAYDFENGGTSLNFHVLTWIDPTNLTAGGNNGICLVKTDSPTPTGCWGANVLTVSPSLFDGQANQTAIAAADNGISGAALVAQRFSEFGINLTQALGGGPLPCFPQQVWESRSSTSFTSNPQDIEFAHLSTCGSITIIKHTNPRGLNQDFSYTTTGGLSPASFTLNDNGNSGGGDSTGNTQSYPSQAAGTYTVTEGADPAGFAFANVSCTGGTTSISGKTVTINLAANDNVVCTYVNNQQLGAIKIFKTAKNKNLGSGDQPQANVSFTITGPNSYSNTVSTGSDGTACVDHLVFGSYTVTETVPSNYAADSTNPQTTTVGTNTTCSGSPNTLSFKNTPLSTITLGFHSLAGAGVTSATVQCTGEGSAANLPEGDATKTLGNGTSTLRPGTYTCTVVIDP
jgi:hypothetical protein